MDELEKAFPLHQDLTSVEDMSQKGMTLLDYFAAKVLQSYMINCEGMRSKDGYIANTCYPELASYSYAIAGAMIEERKKHLK